MLSFLKELLGFKQARKKFDFSTGKKINILIELDTFDKGGLQKVVLDSALRLDSSRFDVTIVSVKGEGYWADVAKQAGITVFALDQLEGKSFADILVKRDIDLACSHFSRAGYPLYKKLGIPNITFIHNVYAFMPDRVVKLFRNDDRYVDLYISVSPNATRYAVKRLGVNPDKVITVPNGLIIEEHEKREQTFKTINREDYGVKASDYLFLNVASYNLHKGHYLMADAMKKIKAVRNDIKILCVGNVIYKPHVDAYMAYLKANNLEKDILMPGYFSDIEAFHHMSDAFFLPSFIEGWSIAMNEAMYYEKPMILTDTGGAAEVIENNDIGILIPNEYGDSTELHSALLDKLAYDHRSYAITDQLVAAMMNFADNREYWKQAGCKGRKKILEKYNFDDVVRQYEKIFFDLLSKSD